MSLRVLDTDTLSLLQERHSADLVRVAACDPNDIAVTVVSVEAIEPVRFRMPELTLTAFTPVMALA